MSEKPSALMFAMNSETVNSETLPDDILTELDPALLREHGLDAQDTATMLKILGRNPSLTELGIFSVMFSEHCSYKSSRKYLSMLPIAGTPENNVVICGPGENAGVIDIGGGYAAIFKMESHNHPSFIEPYQGAATGVGGIMRDVFTMGARPIALLNALRFGALNHLKTRHLVNGVVAGIGGYGNCMGVATIGGETEFDPAYNDNILVNAMCVGIARKDKIFYSVASGIGNSVLYVGAHTGRDGIHGATMASMEFVDDVEQKKPTVQVGDPFTEKRLMEACLELMETDAVIAIQDMGAAGLTSSSVEMAGKGGLGIAINLDHVPKREENMSGYELMLSESQERMLLVVAPDQVQIVYDIFRKHDLEIAIIGTLNKTGKLSLTQRGKCIANIPVQPLSTMAPCYGEAERPVGKAKANSGLELTNRARFAKDPDIAKDSSLAKNPSLAKVERASPRQKWDEILQIFFQHPNFVSKQWVWQQYDSTVGGHNVTRPGGDAAIIHIPENGSALVMASDSNPGYVFANPVMGGRQIIAESWRNLTTVGATPLAITNNLNFASPENPEIMAEFCGTLQGMKQACEAFNYPVISGNVSFYNETNHQGRDDGGILPTPVIGGVGLIKDLSKIASMALNKPDLHLYLLGETYDEFGASAYEKIILQTPSKHLQYAPPIINLHAEKQHGDFVRELIMAGRINVCHDVAQGGLLPAIVKMLFLDYHEPIGVELQSPPVDKLPTIWWFSETQARYIIAMDAGQVAEINAKAKIANIPITKLGVTTNTGNLVIANETLKLAKLYHPYKNFLSKQFA